MNALVGYTGFVGSNIYEKGIFEGAYNSKNIEEAYGTNPDLLIYAGLRAEKYLANNNPEKDLALVEEAKKNIEKINPKQIVLISTIDVFKNPEKVDETTNIETEGLQAYGYNRYLLECWVREKYPDALIIRLPGLFGENIKKNFIYDYIHRIPFMLKADKMDELLKENPDLADYYEIQNNGFYQVKILSDEEKVVLKKIFIEIGFSALNFTDSRSIYQFYPLSRLWNDIQIALSHNIRLWHPATEPVSAGELYYYLTGDKFVNELPGKPAVYDYKTIYDKEFQGAHGYICNKEDIKQEIKKFIEEQCKKEISK